MYGRHTTANLVCATHTNTLLIISCPCLYKQIFKWILQVVEPQRERLTSTPTNKKKNCTAQSEVVPRNHFKSNQSQKTVDFRIISSCKNFDSYTEASFYSTLNLKSIHTMKIKRENIARGLGISFNKGVDSAAAHVRNTKVLPLSDSAIVLSSGQYCKNYEKSAQKAKADKTKASSKMKEILRWVAAAKTEMRGKCTSCKVLHFRNKATLKAIPDDELNNESPKISFRWDVENCSNISSSVYSAHSVSSSTLNTDQTSKPGSWITTDSEYVVLEL